MSKQKADGMDYALLAAGVDDMREMVRSFVVALVFDGFTEEQARTIVTGMFAGLAKGADDEPR